MKRRGWRVALTVATIGVALVAGLVVFNWATVCDHAEAWWFVWTEETETIVPDPAFLDRCKTINGYRFRGARDLLCFLASSSGYPVIASRDHLQEQFMMGVGHHMTALQIVRSERGLRVIEQRFPRHAYVVTGYPPVVTESQRLQRGATTTLELEASPR